MPTYTAKPGLYVSNGGLETSYEWQRDGVAIPGETGLSYTTVSPDDDFSEVAFAETAVDTNGSVTNRVVAKPQPFPVYLRFAGDSIVQTRYDGTLFTTRNFTFAYRIRINSIPASNNFFTDLTGSIYLRLNSSNANLFFLAATANPTDFSIQSTVAPGVGVGDYISVIASASLDAALPGGSYCQIWANGSLVYNRATAPSGLTGSTYFNCTRLQVNPGPDADIKQWFWFDLTANDPTTLAPLMFDASNNYEVRNIGPSGVVNGVSPSVFFNGPPSVWNTPNNSGTGAEVFDYNTVGSPITGLLT